MAQYKVLIVGSGGREHALAWRLSLSAEVSQVHIAPGNGGMQSQFTCHDVPASDSEALCELAERLAIDLVLVGPEAPLVAGLADQLRGKGLRVFGPGEAGAKLEASKSYSKDFMTRYGIPTARYDVVRSYDEGVAALAKWPGPVVVKADGLAAGKGVVVAEHQPEAMGALDLMMRHKTFGNAADTVVLEERLVGREISYHVITDGKTWIPMAPVQDHKRLLDRDLGPNTGGMGTYSPPPFFTKDLELKVQQQIVEPTIAGLQKDGIDFRGVIFIGLMIVENDPYALEYNVRFGDPETETLMTRLDCDIFPYLWHAAGGSLHEVSGEPLRNHGAALSVVIASDGYPHRPRLGDVIEGLPSASELSGVRVFHASTRHAGIGYVSTGGRVLVVSARAPNLDEAGDNAYAAVARIKMDGMQFRKDIGWQARSKRD